MAGELSRLGLCQHYCHTRQGCDNWTDGTEETLGPACHRFASMRIKATEPSGTFVYANVCRPCFDEVIGHIRDDEATNKPNHLQIETTISFDQIWQEAKDDGWIR